MVCRVIGLGKKSGLWIYQTYVRKLYKSDVIPVFLVKQYKLLYVAFCLKAWRCTKQRVQKDEESVSTCTYQRILKYIVSRNGKKSILTWYREYRDQKGGLPRSRPFHCTPVRLKPAIAPNVGNSGTQFFSVGDCVRAIPRLINTKKKKSLK